MFMRPLRLARLPPFFRTYISIQETKATGNSESGLSGEGRRGQWLDLNPEARMHILGGHHLLVEFF